MKKVILTAILSFFSQVQSQTFFKTFGDEPRYQGILLIEVVDNETHEMISGAKITLNSSMFKYPEVFRTSNGVVVFIFKFYSDRLFQEIRGEVTHPNYAPSEFTVSEYDYREEINRTVLNLPNYERFEPTSSEIADELRNGRYNIYGRNLLESRGGTVGCQKLQIALQKIRNDVIEPNRIQRRERNERRDVRRNEEQQNQKPTETLVKCTDCNGSGVCSDCNGKGKIYDSRGGWTGCMTCRGTGKCRVCGGRGQVVRHIQ